PARHLDDDPSGVHRSPAALPLLAPGPHAVAGDGARRETPATPPPRGDPPDGRLRVHRAAAGPRNRPANPGKAMPQITPDQGPRTLAQIRAGRYPHIAAEAAGVPRWVFAGWLRRGRQHSRGWQRRFWLKVREARAHAHALAAVEVRKKDVKFWLRYGPGKP